jgi:hypothetical protein
MNPTKTQVTINPNKILANVSIVDTEQIHPFDTNLDMNSVKSVSAIPQNVSSKQETSNLEFNINNTNLNASQKKRLREFLMRNSDVFSTSLADIGKTDIYKHNIETEIGAKPVRLPPYRQNPIQKAETERQCNEFLENNIIKESDSVWNSPVVLVKKKDGTWRFAVDYRKLNSVTVPISHPLPRLEDVFDALGESHAKVFSILDLNSAYFQIELDPLTRHKSAFVTHQGVFEFTRMPFGLRNAPNELPDANEFSSQRTKLETRPLLH